MASCAGAVRAPWDNASMSVSADTEGLQLRRGSTLLRDAVELISSMRFAIALLTLICIASVIGTVIRQHEPANNYVNQFGPFWAEVYGALGLYSVYSAWWFLLILAFLVISTSLCIARNTPKILADLKSYKEHVREQALRAFHHKASTQWPATAPDAALKRVAELLGREGWKARLDVRGNGTMVAARKGMANKVGYLAAHSAIVLICLGGLLDGDLIVRAQMLLLGKTPYTGAGLLRDVPAEHRLSAASPTFRVNLLVPEGGRAGTAVLQMPQGVVLQELPFDIELKKFIVDYYATGMPKLFASQIVIHDHDGSKPVEATVKVNEPVFHRGVAIYQSSFDDGGSTLKLRAWPLGRLADGKPAGEPFDISGRVGSSTELQSGKQHLTLEFAALRVINVENLGGDRNAGTSGADVRKVDLVGAFKDHLGSGAKPNPKRTLTNVGPSVSYRLRDGAGQAREYHNYMLPMEIDGQRVFLVGVRDNPNDALRYLRIPVDADDSAEGWLRLRQALADPALRSKAVRRYIAQASPQASGQGSAQATRQLEVTTERVLEIFAGAAAATRGDAAGPRATAVDKPADEVGGLVALSHFLESTVPEPDRQRISEVLLRLLQGGLYELANLSREAAGKPPLAHDEKTQAFIGQSIAALSDSFYYPAPLLLQLTGFDQLQASVFQVARAPGKTVVYLGAVLLMIGVFAMLYIRERRLWIWLQADGNGGTKLDAALSTTRRTLDADAEFERLRESLLAGGISGATVAGNAATPPSRGQPAQP